MTLHLEFPRRTEVGPGIFKVKDMKLGRQLSTVHLTFSQNDHEEVVGYLTHSNLLAEDGVSFPTGWKLEPPTKPMRDAKKMGLNRGDDTWVEQTDMPFAKFRRASNQVRFFFPRTGQPLKGINDQWIKFTDPSSRFTTETLGYVCDMFPQVVEAFRDEDDPYRVSKPEDPSQTKEIGARYWYPTVVLNIDVKKALPEEGVEWLFCRTRSKQIRKGRLDIEVVIMDEQGELVALSHHVALVLSAGRNLAKRQRDGTGSKI
jgi:hypothetical protein